MLGSSVSAFATALAATRAGFIGRGGTVNFGPRAFSSGVRSLGIVTPSDYNRAASSVQYLHSRATTSSRRGMATESAGTPASSSNTEYVTLSQPAPGSPFHYAFPVHDLALAKEFYGNVLGCEEGRSSDKWQDYALHGHQIVAHWVGDDYRCVDYFNPVDGDEVPVPHVGLALTEEQFHALAQRVRDAGVKFIIEPHLRFQGQPGEQWTMFFKDPSGNNLEFKAMTTIENLFAKYNVKD